MQKTKIIWYVIGLAGLTFFLFASLHYLQTIPIMSLMMIRLTVIMLDVMIATYLLWQLFVVARNKKKLIFTTALFVYSLFLCFLAAEAACMFIPQSHGTGYTYGHVNWKMYFWHPMNQFGYRDREHDVTDIHKKNVIAFLGDSFTAGAGIPDVDDRFSNIIQSRMPDAYTINLGLGGSDTTDAFKRLKNFPIKPDILVYQYFIDDISGAALSNGMKRPPFVPYINMPRFIRPLIVYSYFFNFVYWRFPQFDRSLYLEFNISAHRNPRVLKDHLSDVKSIISYCDDHHIQLLVVLFPFLQAVEESGPLLKPVQELFRGSGIPVINTGDFLSSISLRKRIVSYNDPHPSKLIHSLVAEKLHEVLMKTENQPSF